MSPPDIVLTGPPRSGTTLACALLNRFPNTVALHEPMHAAALDDPADHDRLAREIAAFFGAQRSRLVTQGLARSKQVHGIVPDNPFAPAPDAWGRRPPLDALGDLRVTKPLAPDFTLVIKHTTRFVALLPVLTRRFPVFAVVRNPLATLASWSTLDSSLRLGQPGPAGQLDGRLMARLRAIPDPVDRQIALLSWFHAQIATHLPADHIIRYETLVASGGGALRIIKPEAAWLATPLTNQNRNPVYPRLHLARLGERLLATDGGYWRFYSRASVERLLAEQP